MNVGSLFSGIGGLDLGLERAGMTVRWQSENDPYCCRVLAKHWPHVPNLGDVTQVDWSQVEPVDLICGGYPCQPFSLAGTRTGEQDPRHLWPRFADAIRELRPRYALLENVPGHLSLGFGRVLGDLAGSGYDTVWDCIPAAAVGAPHLRYRIFVVAYPHEHQHQGSPSANGRATTAHVSAYPQRDQLRHQPVSIRRGNDTAVVGDDGTNGHVADTDGGGRQERCELDSWAQHGIESSLGNHTGGLRADVADTDSGGWDRWSGQLGSGRRGEPADGGWWAVEPDVGRVANGVPHRVDRLRALGNAVVPQVAELIGRRILEAAA